MDNNKSNKKVPLIFGAVVGGAILLSTLGVPGFSSNPIEKAYNRCVSVKTEKMKALQGVGYPPEMLNNIIQMGCGSIHTACQNPDSPICQLMINSNFQD